jgi:Tfp pilus assembly protein PilF
LKSFLKLSPLLLIVLAARGDLATWVQNIEAGTPLEAVFFKNVTIGTASVPARRPPAETRPELTKLIGASPSDGELYSLRALEDEQALDLAAAEADWTKYAQLAADKFAAQTALADFYDRRVEPAKELAALHAAAVLPGPQQRSWKTFERMIALIDDHLLGFDAARTEFRAWITRHANEPAAYTRFVDYAVEHKQFNDANQAAVQYAGAFPNDKVFPVKAQAEIEAARGSTQTALALYDRSFQPLWPPALVKSYFDLLKQAGSLRAYLQAARTHAGDLNGAARIFYYWQQQGNLVNAQHALVEFESRKQALKSAWGAEELWTLAQLYETANNPDRAARCYYAMYSMPNAAAAEAERALAGIANLLFTYADQGIRFGASDLSYYRDIAQADPYPGYLNGILSLILNTTESSYKYSDENQRAQPYFHRAMASDLVALFDSRFPKSAMRPALHAKRINAYMIYGDNRAVIQSGLRYRSDFPNAPERTGVAELMADAYARTGQTAQEFALYNELLEELAKRAGGVPVGEPTASVAIARRDQQEQGDDQQEKKDQPPAARSPEYARILDRYIARLTGLKRIPDALALYRREIDRNPNDPGLYERFAAFLAQNRMGAEVEATYKRAIAQFPGGGWTDKLARWYLRQKQTAQLAALTREVADKFSGTELEAYFREAVPRGSLGAALYLQLNLYAHKRFPHNLAFTRNLLTAYQTRGTADAAAFEALLRANWTYADDLRSRFFEYLSRTRRLDAELAALGNINTPQQVNANPVAARMLAEGEAWRTHFESSAPVFRAMTVSYPATSPVAERAAAVYRSLATVDPRQTDVAAGIEQNLVSYSPGSSAALTYDGEIFADRERFDRARPLWNRIATAKPGNEDGYLESATVFWDYFLYDDALRVIDEGRKKLNKPSLFAYQAGAIYENKRQYDRALNEYANAVLDDGNDLAERRLVRLARRPNLRDSVERLTANMANRADASSRALRLRAAVLENQGRRNELEQFLMSAASRTSTLDTLDWIDTQGSVQGFPKVQEAAKLRRVAVTTDPVDQMHYQLSLAHFYEDQSRTADAQRVLTTLAQAHPTTLGVLRAATDYFWRSGQPKRAVETLASAADRAQPLYQRAFRLEAARKATESGDTATARQLAGLLLKDDPYRAEYLTAMADTYARAGDDRGLRTFYQSTMASLRASNLSAGEKTERIAAMRRGLIPVLTRLKDYTGALDQYIEIVNRYAEDEGLTREAASYAGDHQLGDRLIAYYAKTQAAAPRDFRWAMVLARVYTELEKVPEAIQAYSKAMAVRPDRTDLWIAQAQLDERLLRFADAEKNYLRLYELTYHNSIWMEHVGLLRASQGQKDGAVAALRAAYIENRPERADNYFTVAMRLDNWGMLDQARPFAEKGAELAGPDLVTQNEYAGPYARILGRARQYEAAYARLTKDGADPEKAPALPAAMHALGETVKTYYTPEEKTAFAQFIQKQAASKPAFDALESAALEDPIVERLLTTLRANPADLGAVNRLIDHQRRRLRFGVLGAQLEAAWRAMPPQTDGRDTLLARAASAYAAAGDPVSELRVIRIKKAQSGLDNNLIASFCTLLAQQPQALVNVAGTDPAGDMRDMAANCAIQNSRPADALNAVLARGQGLKPVWTSAYTGLTGLYFGMTTPQVNDAFLAALGSPVIGDRVGKPADPDRQLAGQPWFYYGSRYGEYLALARQANAGDYLPAMLEAAPGNADGYYNLAEYYREAGNSDRALTGYAHTLELDSNRGTAHDRMGEVLWTANRHDEALNEFRLALQSFNAQQDRGPVPPAFVEDVKTTLEHVGGHELLVAVRPDADRLLKTYLRRNGTYMFEPLLDGILAAAGDPAKGVAWLVDLSQATADPMKVIAAAVRTSAVPDAQRDLLYQRLIDADQAKFATSFGQPRETAENSLRSWQMEWLRSLVSRGEAGRARALLNSIPEKARKNLQNEVIPLEVQIAAQSNSIPALLAASASAPDTPPLDALRTGASELRRSGQDAAARRVLEFVYTHQLEAHQFDSSTFLGLAEIRLEEKQTAAAVELLKRMTLVSPEPFETLAPAAALLARYGQTSEAANFYDLRLKAAPWDVTSREQLASLRGNTADLGAVASDASATYAVRADAAAAVRHSGGAALTTGSAELDLLAASTSLTEQAANKPFWYRARLETAAGVKDSAAKLRILLAATSVDPVPTASRLDLFRAALDQKRYALAIASVPSQSETPPEAPSDSGKLPEWVVNSFMPNTPFGQAERAVFARGLGEAYQRMNDPAHAVYYYRLALEMDRSPAATKAIEPALKAMRERVELRRANEVRRPVVTTNLEQPHIVRPRLTVARGGAR